MGDKQELTSFVIGYTLEVDVTVYRRTFSCRVRTQYNVWGRGGGDFFHFHRERIETLPREDFRSAQRPLALMKYRTAVQQS
jgi:hypothetical protein